MRERFFTPRLRVKSYDELNAWLTDKCIAWAKAHAHPEQPDRTIWEVFEEERPKLVPYRGRFDGFHALPASESKTCLVRFDNNKYSVSASAVGRPVEIHAYADRVVIRQDGRIVAEHPRRYGRGETIYDPWHYVPVLAAQAGSLAQRRAVQGLGVADGARPGCATPTSSAGASAAPSIRHQPRGPFCTPIRGSVCAPIDSLGGEAWQGTASGPASRLPTTRYGAGIRHGAERAQHHV